MRKLWIMVSVPAEPKDWSLLKLQHTGLCGFPWRQPAYPLSVLDSCPAAERNNRILVVLLAWCVERTGKLWTFIHNLTFLYKVKIQMLIPTVFHLNDYEETSVVQLLFTSGVRDVQYDILQYQLVLVVWFSFLISFSLLLHCCVCFLWGTELKGVLWGCLLLDCMTPVIQLLLQSVLVSAGIESVFFLVAGTVLCFGFSVRITLITRWCFSCC